MNKMLKRLNEPFYSTIGMWGWVGWAFFWGGKDILFQVFGFLMMVFAIFNYFYNLKSKPTPSNE